MASNQAASALSWWRESGVDTLVAEEPRDWLNPRAPAAAAAAEAPVPATLPDDLGAFRDWLATSPDLPLAAPGARRISPAGDPASGLMMLVDMPSAEDVAAGALVSGEVGAMFDRMLARMGLSRERVYLASLSTLRTPSGRIDPENAKRLTAIARHHIGLAAPRAVLLFGDACSRALVGRPALGARGRWHTLDTPLGPIKAIVTMSLHYLHGQPSARKEAWEDLQLLMEGLTP